MLTVVLSVLICSTLAISCCTRTILLLFWQSFDFPADTILGNQTLYYGIELVSSVSSSSDHSSGRYRLKMQYNGNLIAYLVNCTDSLDAYWSFVPGMGEYNISDIQHTLAKSFAYDTITLIIYHATLDDDGIFRLYSHRFASNTSPIVSMEWSVMQDHCQVHGFCGFNSFCSRNSYEKDCYYPGFVLFNPSKMFLGCYRNFTKQRCNSEEAFGLVNITSLENLSFLLRYGMKSLSNLATAFVKISSKTEIPNQLIISSSYTLTENKGHLISILAVSLGSLACLCIVIAGSSFFVYRHRVHKYKKLSDNAKLGLTTEEFSLRSFSYNELEEATNGFKEELGKGSFEAVYKGTLCKGKMLIAVKRLEKVVEEGERDFQAEMRAIGTRHHRNLVPLLGYCIEGSKRLLVYEYISNGSLAELLFKSTRLAKLLIPDQTRTFTELRGTRGYLALERQRNNPISVKADVYSYGIVLLEITLENMVKVGLWCIQDEPALLPSMKSAVMMLEGITDISIPPCPTTY
ncbi:hypothetical protein ACSBR2_011377 [Camellia fascicularis]